MYCLEYLPDILLEEVEQGHAALVGGAIRCHFEGTEPTDMDVFFFSQENYERFCARYGAVPVEGTGGLVSEFVHNGMKIELVHQPGLVNAELCVAAADFDIASGVYSGGILIHSETFQKAIKRKEFKYLAPVLSAGSAQRSYTRCMKYCVKYGYQIDSSVQVLLQRWRDEVGR